MPPQIDQAAYFLAVARLQAEPHRQAHRSSWNFRHALAVMRLVNPQYDWLPRRPWLWRS